MNSLFFPGQIFISNLMYILLSSGNLYKSSVLAAYGGSHDLFIIWLYKNFVQESKQETGIETYTY